MATSVMFGKKLVKLPGTYGRIVSGIKNEIPLSEYGNVLLIDAGIGDGYNSAMGIGGKGKEAIYSLDKDEANFYIKGGQLAPVINSLFFPSKGVSGISRLFLIKAATSTSASISTWSVYGGAITATKIETVEQGEICNTNLVSDVLKTGYQLKALYDTTLAKGYLELWLGTYQGTNKNGYIVSETEANSQPVLVYRTKKYSTPKELFDELNTSKELKSLITITGLTLVAQTFTATTETLSSFTGGTDTYLTNLSTVFDLIKELNYSFMMVAGVDGAQTFNSAALNHILNDARGIKQLVTYSPVFADAIEMAQDLNDDAVICCSGVVKQTNRFALDGFIKHDPIVTAALILGRIAGLRPEIPGTMKSLNIDAMEVEPSDIQLENMLDAGVISPYFDTDLGYFCMSQAVNTLQKNDYFINEDATTYSIQVKRIISEVIKNLQYQAKLDFYGGEAPTNKASLSNAYLLSWTRKQLERMVARPENLNQYLLSYEVTKIENKESNSFVYFNFTVNGEVSKVFFIGTILG